MRKGFYSVTFSLVLIMALLTGCTGNNDLANDNENLKKTIGKLEAQVVELQGLVPGQGNPTLIKATTTDPRSSKAWTKLSSFDFDYDLNGEEETLTLYTAAEKDDKGRIMWDDGQEWLLLLNDKASFFPLFQEYVQIGTVQFSVSQADDKTLPTIQLMVTTGTSLNIYNISFNEDENAYSLIQVYESGVLNQFFSSIPEYQ